MKNSAKDDLLRTRIPKKDKEALEQIAASQNLSLSAYARAKLMDSNFTSIYIDIPNLIDTYKILNMLCQEIDKSGNKHLMGRKKRLMKSLLNHKEEKLK